MSRRKCRFSPPCGKYFARIRRAMCGGSLTCEAFLLGKEVEALRLVVRSTDFVPATHFAGMKGAIGRRPNARGRRLAMHPAGSRFLTRSSASGCCGVTRGVFRLCRVKDAIGPETDGCPLAMRQQELRFLSGQQLILASPLCTSALLLPYARCAIGRGQQGVKRQADALGFGLEAGEVEAEDLFEGGAVAADNGAAVEEKCWSAFDAKRFPFREVGFDG